MEDKVIMGTRVKIKVEKESYKRFMDKEIRYSGLCGNCTDKTPKDKLDTLYGYMCNKVGWNNLDDIPEGVEWIKRSIVIYDDTFESLEFDIQEDEKVELPSYEYRNGKEYYGVMEKEISGYIAKLIWNRDKIMGWEKQYYEFGNKNAFAYNIICFVYVVCKVSKKKNGG